MFGVVVGRVINRIANASYELNGKTHKLAPNDEHGSALHGGAGLGWAHRRWELVNTTADSATYALKSPDGDQKFPGALDVSVTYLLKNDSLKMTMVVAADEGNKEATPVNIAQHSYFNLDGHAAGARSIKQLKATIDATHRAVLRADGTALPTGAVEPVAGGPFDFHHGKNAGRALGDSWNATTDPEPGLGYEVMYVTGNKTLAQAKSSTTRPAKLTKNSSSTKSPPVGCSATKDGSPIRAARFVAPCSGRTLEAWTSAPAFEIYTGNHLDKGLIGKGKFFFFFWKERERERERQREEKKKRNKKKLTSFLFRKKKTLPLPSLRPSLSPSAPPLHPSPPPLPLLLPFPENRKARIRARRRGGPRGPGLHGLPPPPRVPLVRPGARPGDDPRLRASVGHHRGGEDEGRSVVRQRRDEKGGGGADDGSPQRQERGGCGGDDDVM